MLVCVLKIPLAIQLTVCVCVGVFDQVIHGKTLARPMDHVSVPW